MPITRMYLVLWTIIAFVSGIFLALYNDNFLLSLASIGIIAITHIIAWGNFKLHYRPLHDILFRVLA